MPANIAPLQLAWIISFISTILAHVNAPIDFPLYTYWALVFFLAMIIGVFVVVASDSTQTYHVAIVGYLGCGLVLSTSSVNGLIHTSMAAKEAAAAGFILLAMVNVRIPGCFSRLGPRSPFAFLAKLTVPP